MLNKIYRIIPAGSIVLAVLTLGSYVLGLVRDRTFAHTFGATRTLDAYNAAFILPDFLFNILVASGIAAAFVPIFTDLLKANRDRAEEYINSVLTVAIGIMTVMALIIFAGAASRVVAPGFSPEDQAIVATLLRILAISPIIFAASNALGALLIAKHKFLYYGLSPLLYNAGIIMGTMFLVPSLGIMGVAYGTIAGALLHLIIRMFGTWSVNFKLRFKLAIKTAEFKKTVKLMIPKMFGHPVELATFWGFTAIASTLAPGSIVVLNFARNFQSVPVSIIGIAIATAVFPTLAQAASDKSQMQFKDTLKSSFWLIFFTSLFSAVLIFIIREPLVSIVLGGKAFGPDAVKQTAMILGFFSLAIPTEASSQLIARAFYATKNTLIPVVFSIVSFAIAVGGSYLLTPTLGIIALPLTFAAASAIKLVLLMVMLPKQLNRI
jgi:putative peptidoglycan lipid II flippase